MVIESLRTNISGLQIIQQLHKTDGRIQTNIQRIASGLRINRPADDPSSFVVSSKLHTQFRSLNRASENTQEAISLINTAESAVTQIISLLNDVRTAVVAASGGSITQQFTIQEKIEELNRIANSTRFGGKYLLNGTYQTEAGFLPGTRPFGASLAFGPDATTLFEGRSYLNIGVTQHGLAQINSGGDSILHTGVANAPDIAVSTAQFNKAGSGPATGDALVGLTANRVTIASADSIQFSGVLADGATFFGGGFSIVPGSTVSNLISAMQDAINAAESKLGIQGTGQLETTVQINSQGRLQFSSGSSENISQFSIDIYLKNISLQTKTSFSISRNTQLYNQEYGGTTTSASIGNKLSAITGSTFDSGAFTIKVAHIIAPERRQITTLADFDQNTGGTAVLSTTTLDGSFLNGVSLASGATFLVNGTDPDGTTFSSIFTIGTDTGVGDGMIETYQDLIDELNNRNQALLTRGFNGALATLTGDGEIQLIDDIAAASSTNLQILVSAGNQSIESRIDQLGTEERATVSIDGGPMQDVSAGQMVTLQGRDQTGDKIPEMTFRIGNGLAAGSDTLVTSAQMFVGSLNGGEPVPFQNGDKNVRFTSGEYTLSPMKKFQQVTLDFGAIVDVSMPASAGGETFILSTTSRTANFHIGSDADEIIPYLFADLRSRNLGLDATHTLDDINVTSLSGVTEAFAIVDAALDQVNGFASRLGAFSSRLNDTIASLDLGAINIETAHSRIVSADFAKEATELTSNSLLMQAQSVVLAQANSLPQTVLDILLNLNKT